MRLEFNDLNEVIKYYSKKLLKSGEVKTTNIKNKERYKNLLGGEVLQQFFIIKNPTKVLGTWENHKYYKWWMFGEILSEFLNLDPPLMYKYKPKLFSQHYDLLEDGRMQYTYSSRFVEFNQFVNIYRKLKKNPNSKRCVISIHTPYDTSNDRHDSPCTLMYSFIHRNGKLNMTVFYRSWDFFGGFKTYDFALSSFILQSFCSWLEMKPGNLGIYVTSLHFYNRDKKQLERLVKECKNSKKNSNELILEKKIDITNFYKQLRKIKRCEEAGYNGNLGYARRIKAQIKCKLFKDICDVWIKKNER